MMRQMKNMIPNLQKMGSGRKICWLVFVRGFYYYCHMFWFLPSWKLTNILFLDGTIESMISSFFPFGEMCDGFLEGNNHATWENLMQTGFWDNKKKTAKKNWEQKTPSAQNSNGELFHRAHVVCSLPLPTPTQKEQNIQDKSFVKKKIYPKTAPKPSFSYFCLYTLEN